MLRRALRASVAAARNFSTKTEKVPAPAPAPAPAKDALLEQRKSASGTSVRDSLGRRIFSLVYPTRSAVIAIRKWKEEGHDVKNFELNRIIRELRKLKRYKHALEVSEWIMAQEGMKLVSGDYAVHLDLIAKNQGLANAEKFFEDIPENMRDHATCNALLHTYVRFKEFEKADALMETMAERELLTFPISYNHMLSLYISAEQFEKVPEIMKKLEETTSPDIVTYNLLLSACASQNDVETAEKIFHHLTKAKIEPQWMTYSTLASLYIKNSLPEKAGPALKEMEKRVSKKDRGAYSSLITLHSNLENKEGVWCIWNKMKATYRKLSDAEYTHMIVSLLKLKEVEEAEELYNEWEYVSPTKDTRIPNLLLAAYVTNNQFETAESFHNRMVGKGIGPSYRTWELLTWLYVKQKQVDKAVDCFKKAFGSVKNWEPDEKLIREVFMAVEEAGEVEWAEKLLNTLRDAGYVRTEAYNFLLRTYAKAGKMPLIVRERMEKDGVEMDEETKRLVQETSKMCVGEILPRDT